MIEKREMSKDGVRSSHDFVRGRQRRNREPRMKGRRLAFSTTL